MDVPEIVENVMQDPSIIYPVPVEISMNSSPEIVTCPPCLEVVVEFSPRSWDRQVQVNQVFSIFLVEEYRSEFLEVPLWRDLYVIMAK